METSPSPGPGRQDPGYWSRRRLPRPGCANRVLPVGADLTASRKDSRRISPYCEMGLISTLLRITMDGAGHVIEPAEPPANAFDTYHLAGAQIGAPVANALSINQP